MSPTGGGEGVYLDIHVQEGNRSPHHLNAKQYSPRHVNETVKTHKERSLKAE